MDPIKTSTNELTTPNKDLTVGEAITQSEPGFKGWLKHSWKWLAPVIIVLLLAGGAATYAVLKPAPKQAAVVPTKTPVPTPTPTPTPTTVPAPLTGLPVEPALAARPISAVMIENLYPDARPQSGLSQAGVVYEALAEGGITRFLALFGDQQPSSIGPVRSLRPYYIDWALEFGASLSHAGGSSDALNLVGPLGVLDLNALVIGAPTYYRTSDRYAPHNLYTSSALLDAINARHGYTKAPSFTPSPRQPDAPMTTPTHTTISINFSSGAYAVQYRYAPTINSYIRYLGGVPHVDRNTGQPITVKNIVIEYMPITYTPAPHDSQYINMPTVGSGRATVLRDGGAAEGTWSKASHNARTQLTDASGTAIALDAGNTWYEIVPIGNAVSY
ncbi:DUF3048 domain-containing protein [Candidatus Saccharibacteria bacterium]|nr:DUF3048 domain-containing protein [Candidatus Saccharibacteria bacterium]